MNPRIPCGDKPYTDGAQPADKFATPTFFLASGSDSHGHLLGLLWGEW